MLSGTFLYLLALGIFFNSVLSIILPIVFILFMAWEVKHYEEPRLGRDFGAEYIKYKRKYTYVLPKA